MASVMAPPRGAPLFVHDFAAVELPPDAAARLFTLTPDATLAGLVGSAWNRHTGLLRSVGQDTSVRLVEVCRHRHELRHGAAIVNMSWRGDNGLPTLDADLELVGFGAGTHLHLMGRYEMPAGIERFSATGSLLHRVMVMTVRCFLTELGTHLESAD